MFVQKQLVNCCAAYQAQLQQRQQEKEGLPSDEDQLDIDMGQLSNAVQTVDCMLDEIDQLLKVLFIKYLVLFLLFKNHIILQISISC